MSAVDVLAAFNEAIDAACMGMTNEALCRAIEARAAVAELLAASEEKLESLSPDGIGHYRLRDAIKGCKGESA